MGMFTWQEKYSVRNAVIDEQHKGLFHAADELHAAMLRGAGRQVIGATLDALIDYTQTHFREEEQLMQKYKFPQYAQHKAEHDKFIRQAKGLKDGLSTGQAAITVSTMQFLNDWLKNHIIGLDTKIAQHIESASGRKVA